MTVDVDDIEEQSCCPRADAAAEPQRPLAFALHKGIRTGGTEAGGKVVDALTRDTALKQRLLSTGKEDLPAPAANFRHRLLCDAVLYSNTTGMQLQVDGGTGKVAEVDTAYPTVACLLHEDGVPTMVFILRIPVINGRFHREILHATLCQLALMATHKDVSTAKFLVDGRCEGCIKNQGVVANVNNRTIPAQLNVSRLPPRIIQAAAEVAHTQMVNPLPCAGTDDGDSEARGERCEVRGERFLTDGGAACRDVVGNEAEGIAWHLRLALDVKQGSAVGAVLDKDGLGSAHATQHHA